MIDFGKGPTLEEASPWLRNRSASAKRILDAVERNSVIEGLPPFQENFRRRLLDQFSADASPPEPAE